MKKYKRGSGKRNKLFRRAMKRRIKRKIAFPIMKIPTPKMSMKWPTFKMSMKNPSIHFYGSDPTKAPKPRV